MFTLGCNKNTFINHKTVAPINFHIFVAYKMLIILKPGLCLLKILEQLVLHIRRRCREITIEMLWSQIIYMVLKICVYLSKCTFQHSSNVFMRLTLRSDPGGLNRHLHREQRQQQ